MSKKLRVVIRKKANIHVSDFLFAELVLPKSVKRTTVVYVDIRRYYDEWDKQVLEPQTCNHFGCGKHLSPTEKLYGGRCINHQRKETTLSKIDKHFSV